MKDSYNPGSASWEGRSQCLGGMQGLWSSWGQENNHHPGLPRSQLSSHHHEDVLRYPDTNTELSVKCFAAWLQGPLIDWLTCYTYLYREARNNTDPTGNADARSGSFSRWQLTPCGSQGVSQSLQFFGVGWSEPWSVLHKQKLLWGWELYGF